MSSTPLSSVILAAIVESSIAEKDGVRVAHLDASAIIDAFAAIGVSLIATSPEAATAAGLKRVLRCHARQIERGVAEYRHHAQANGSPFLVTA